MKIKNVKLISIQFTITVILSVTFWSCQKSLPIIDSLQKNNYQLVNQNGESVSFPKDYEGNIIVAGYIFTNCPDICPLTTNNMRLVHEKLKKDKIKNVTFVSISFDPLVDTPETLTKFAKIRDLDLSNWTFLTGSEKTISALMKEIGIVAFVSDSTITSDGEIINYFVHTDRISLIDEKLNIRKNYLGSQANIDEVINDIQTLN